MHRMHSTKPSHFIALAVLLSCTVSSATQARATDLLVLEWNIQVTATSIEVFWRVRNTSTRQWDSVYVKASVWAEGNLLENRPLLIERPNLPSGEESDFRSSISRKTNRDFSVVEEFELNNPKLSFIGSGRILSIGTPTWRVTRNATSQLESLEAKGHENFRRKQEAKKVAAVKSQKELPAWWKTYETATAPLRAAELTLRAVYRAEGQTQTIRRQVMALKQPLVQAAQSLTRAPDQRVQADVQQLFFKLASAIEKYDQGAKFGFRSDYAEAVQLMQKIERKRQAAAKP